MKLQTKIKKPTQKQTAIAFGVTDRTIRNWDRRRKLNKLHLEIGRKGIIKDPRLQTSLRRYSSFLKRDILSTQQDVADRVFEETGQKISQSTVSRFLKQWGIAYKKISYHYDEQLRPENKEKIRKFIEKIPLLSKSPVLAIDECSFHLNEVPKYAYAAKGMRANRRKPSWPGENHTLILCVQNVKGRGVVKWELIPGGMKTKDFHKFISSLNLPTNQKRYLLLDNLKVHHATKSCIKLKLSTIKELMASKNIIPVYLPPYTPELNPVELCFNFLRQNTEKKKPRTFEKLKVSIDKAIKLLEQEDLTKWFQHCWDYFKGEEREKIRRKTVDWSDPLIRQEMFKALTPWKGYSCLIFPSRKWKRLGKSPIKQSIILLYAKLFSVSVAKNSLRY